MLLPATRRAQSWAGIYSSTCLHMRAGPDYTAIGPREQRRQCTCRLGPKKPNTCGKQVEKREIILFYMSGVCQPKDILHLSWVDWFTLFGVMLQKKPWYGSGLELFQGFWRNCFLENIMHEIGVQICRKPTCGAASQQDILSLIKVVILGERLQDPIKDTAATEVQRLAINHDCIFSIP